MTKYVSLHSVLWLVSLLFSSRWRRCRTNKLKCFVKGFSSEQDNKVAAMKLLYHVNTLLLCQQLVEEYKECKKTVSRCITQAALQRLFTGAIPLLSGTGALACSVSDLGRCTPP